MKDGLWGIVNGTEIAPAEAEPLAKFSTIRDKALAIIVLSVDLTLLYLVGDPMNPIEVWKKLADQFQKKTWANKLHMRKKLYSLRLQEGGSVQDHIKTMTETFNALTVIGDTITEVDRVVHFLASLPDLYYMLVTALEACVEVPKMETVIKRLLHEERKLADGKSSYRNDGEKVMAVSRQKSWAPKCYCVPLGITLGDGHHLQAGGRRSVTLEVEMPSGKGKMCNLSDVLCVPNSSYNLLSVSKSTDTIESTVFTSKECDFLNAEGKVVATGKRIGELYYLNCRDTQQAAAAKHGGGMSEAELWHRRYGHLGVQNMKKTGGGRNGGRT